MVIPVEQKAPRRGFYLLARYAGEDGDHLVIEQGRHGRDFHAGEEVAGRREPARGEIRGCDSKRTKTNAPVGWMAHALMGRKGFLPARITHRWGQHTEDRSEFFAPVSTFAAFPRSSYRREPLPGTSSSESMRILAEETHFSPTFSGCSREVRATLKLQPCRLGGRIFRILLDRLNRAVPRSD